MFSVEILITIWHHNTTDFNNNNNNNNNNNDDDDDDGNMNFNVRTPQLNYEWQKQLIFLLMGLKLKAR
jgi:hypothetical protein